MRYKFANGKAIIILDAGDKVIKSLREFAEKENIFGFFFGLGAVKNPIIAYYDLSKREYVKKQFFGEFEVTSLVGNITQDAEGNVIVHAHINLADNSLNCWGGHLIEAEVSVTLEIIAIIHEKIIRKTDDRFKLKLISI